MSGILIVAGLALSIVAGLAFAVYAKSSRRKPGRVRPDAPPTREERQAAKGE